MADQTAKKASPRYFDPTRKNLTTRARWWIAGRANVLIPRTCWANIVSWALGSSPLLDRSGNGDDIRRTSLCFTPGQERCYCGKYASPLSTPRAVSDDR